MSTPGRGWHPAGSPSRQTRARCQQPHCTHEQDM
jgi:hypothetical protein